MTRFFSSALAVIIAVVLLLVLHRSVESSAAYVGGQLSPRTSPARPSFSFTRIVTVTVDPSTIPLTTGLTTYWQVEELNHDTGVYDIDLPNDASDVTVTLSNSGTYSILPGRILITGTQAQYSFAYRTNLKAPRLGNQVALQQAASNNQEYRYIGTVYYSEPYQYVGSDGYGPTSTLGILHWDVRAPVYLPPPVDRYRFISTIGLADPRIADKPDLEIVTATMQVIGAKGTITTVVKNSGITVTGAPAYINLYDRVGSLGAPTSPLDLKGAWCTAVPFTSCPAHALNPLPNLAPGQIITFISGFTLSIVGGRHDVYVSVDGLGGNIGLNLEEDETNNIVWVGSVELPAVFLPIIVWDVSP